MRKVYGCVHYTWTKYKRNTSFISKCWYFIPTVVLYAMYEHEDILVYSAKWVTVALKKSKWKVSYQLIFHPESYTTLHYILLELVVKMVKIHENVWFGVIQILRWLGVIIFEIYRVICRFVIQLGYNTKKHINVRSLIFSYRRKRS